MRAAIDAAGRIVVPKRLRDELGLTAGTELELDAIDGHLEVSIPSRIRTEATPHGRKFVADPGTAPLTTDDVRELLERGRR